MDYILIIFTTILLLGILISGYYAKNLLKKAKIVANNLQFKLLLSLGTLSILITSLIVILSWWI